MKQVFTIVISMIFGLPVFGANQSSQKNEIQSKLGIHLLSAYSLPAKKMIQSGPRILKVFDPQGSNDMRMAIDDFKTANPNGIVTMRVYKDNSLHFNLTDDPKNSADIYWANVLKPTLDKLKTDYSASLSKIDYLEGPNECDNTPDWSSIECGTWHGTFDKRLAELIGQYESGTAHKIKPCIGNIPVGNPGGDKEYMQKVIKEYIPALREAAKYNGCWSYHAYSPDMNMNPDTEAWFSLRYRMFYEELKKDAPDVSNIPMILSEGGIDSGGQGCGWKAHGTIEQYESWMQWFDSEIMKDSYISGITLFQSGDQYWSTFDIDPAADWISEYLNSKKL